jgi:hypothetical protein
MRSEMVGEAVDPRGEQRDLHCARTGVPVVLPILGDVRRLI